MTKTIAIPIARLIFVALFLMGTVKGTWLDRVAAAV
jgi:hypothetical protein